MYCIKCGAGIDDNPTCCMKCGNDLTASSDFSIMAENNGVDILVKEHRRSSFLALAFVLMPMLMAVLAIGAKNEYLNVLLLFIMLGLCIYSLFKNRKQVFLLFCRDCVEDDFARHSVQTSEKQLRLAGQLAKGANFFKIFVYFCVLAIFMLLVCIGQGQFVLSASVCLLVCYYVIEIIQTKDTSDQTALFCVRCGKSVDFSETSIMGSEYKVRIRAVKNSFQILAIMHWGIAGYAIISMGAYLGGLLVSVGVALIGFGIFRGNRICVLISSLMYILLLAALVAVSKWTVLIGSSVLIIASAFLYYRSIIAAWEYHRLLKEGVKAVEIGVSEIEPRQSKHCIETLEMLDSQVVLQTKRSAVWINKDNLEIRKNGMLAAKSHFKGLVSIFILQSVFVFLPVIYLLFFSSTFRDKLPYGWLFPLFLISLLCSLFFIIVSSKGYAILLSKIAKDSLPIYSVLFVGIKDFRKSFLIVFSTFIKTAFWTVLFVVPGIVAYLEYSLSVFIMNDCPEMSSDDCMQESRRLVKGYKWKLFLLNLRYVATSVLAAGTAFFIGVIVVFLFFQKSPVEKILLKVLLYCSLILGHILYCLLYLPTLAVVYEMLKVDNVQTEKQMASVRDVVQAKSTLIKPSKLDVSSEIEGVQVNSVDSFLKNRLAISRSVWINHCILIICSGLMFFRETEFVNAFFIVSVLLLLMLNVGLIEKSKIAAVVIFPAYFFLFCGAAAGFVAFGVVTG